MKFNCCNVSRGDNNEVYLSVDVSSESKEEALYAQKIFSMDTEVTIIPKNILDVFIKYSTDIDLLIKHQYPEDDLKAETNDFKEILNYLQQLKEK
jgi:hypothetical protein